MASEDLAHEGCLISMTVIVDYVRGKFDLTRNKRIAFSADRRQYSKETACANVVSGLNPLI